MRILRIFHALVVVVFFFIANFTFVVVVFSLNGVKEARVYGDEELLHLWRQGETWAFEQYYKRHVVVLLGVAIRKVGDRAVAEELVQDVFLDFFRLKERIHPEEGGVGYLYRALKNRVFNHFRNESVQQRYVDFVHGQGLASHNETEDQLNLRELEQLVQAQVDALPPQCQAVFRLSREQSLSHREIADELGISVNTVEQHIRKALKRLRAGLEGYSLHALLCFLLL